MDSGKRVSVERLRGDKMTTILKSCPFEEPIGKYEIESDKLMTNEQWFCTLSTEEKAKVFANATYSTALAPMEILALGKEFEQKKWEMWLKQPHKE